MKGIENLYYVESSLLEIGSSSSTESERENAPSVLEQLGKKQKEKKRHKPKGSDRTCTTCGISLCDCVDAWLEVLGPRSTYCSMECVEKQVEKAKAVIEDQSARVMLLDRSGTMLNGPSAPKLVDLLQFLREHPEFAPVLPSSQLSPKKSQQHFQTGSSKGGDSENKQQQQRNVSANKSEKLISKENDQRRLQVRRAICEKLLVRAKKTTDLAFTQQELKALSQRIEEELFRQCRHSVSGKYRSWFRQFLICVTDETNKGDFSSLFLLFIFQNFSFFRFIRFFLLLTLFTWT
ncbi:unnamed protein product [Anisakis simplex]|uniref:BRK domain-containing protein n=1 Tax=Anisakis simplex TaxID=6269 RepID=A0A0M3J6F9_ANISI|nr:unnamed protein product [Anisakis simplex]